MTEKKSESVFSDKERSRKETEENIRSRIELEKQAFNVVERLIEPNVTTKYILEIGNLICPNHYMDVIEERVISKLCGYPLCDNVMEAIAKQKYHISTKTNKVYDISERKNFCSNQCYKASKFYENQISSAPIWTREKEAYIEFKLLKYSRGLIGDEVIGSPEFTSTLKREVEELRKLDSIGSEHKTKVRTDSVETGEIIEEENIKVTTEEESNPQQEIVLSCTEQSSVKDVERESYKISQKPNESKTEYMLRLLDKRKNQLSSIVDDKPVNINHQSYDIHKQKTVCSQSKNTKSPNNEIKPVSSVNSDISPLKLICRVVKQWITDRTRGYLKQQNKTINTDDLNVNNAMLCHSLEKRDKDLETLLADELQIRGDKSHTKPLPDYKQLEKDAIQEEIKVREFYRGNFFTNEDINEYKKEHIEDDKAPVVMPTVDSSDQMIIRRRIVFERLMKVMPDSLSTLKLSLQDVTEEIRELIQTFSFNSANIVFKPAQWSLISFIILKMLSKKKANINSCFQQSSTMKYLNIILRGWGHTNDDLCLMVDQLLE